MSKETKHRTYNAKLLAWDAKGKVLEISYWMGFQTLEKAKEFSSSWWQYNHVKCHKWIKIYEDGGNRPVLQDKNF